MFKYKRWCSKILSYLKPDRKFTGIARKAESVAAWKSLLSQLTASPYWIIYHFSPFHNYLFALRKRQRYPSDTAEHFSHIHLGPGHCYQQMRSGDIANLGVQRGKLWFYTGTLLLKIESRPSVALKMITALFTAVSEPNWALNSYKYIFRTQRRHLPQTLFYAFHILLSFHYMGKWSLHQIS